MAEKGFIAALFDFDFKEMVAKRVLRVLYILGTVIVLIIGLVTFLGGLAAGGGEAIMALIFAPLFTLLFLIGLRVYVEMVLVFFKIEEHTRTMAEALAGSSAGGSVSGESPGPGI